MNNLSNILTNNIAAVIPAAGKATRLPNTKGSKEVIPVGYINTDDQNSVMDKPVCMHLLEKLRHAGIQKAHMVIREEKWDIPQTLGSGDCVDMDIAYQMLRVSHGTAYTIDQAYSFVKNNIVALGFPDILITPDDAYVQILSFLEKSNADVVLGLFPADKPKKCDMVEMNDNFYVKNIIIKPEKTKLTLTWGIAVWKPSFTKFLHDFLLNHQYKSSDPEMFIGNVIQQAISQGLIVKAKQVSNSAFLDIGTPDDLERAIKLFR